MLPVIITTPESIGIYETLVDGWTCREWKNGVEIYKQLTVTGTWSSYGEFNKLGVGDSLPFEMEDAMAIITVNNGWVANVIVDSVSVLYDIISDVTSDVTVNIYVRGKKTE